MRALHEEAIDRIKLWILNFYGLSPKQGGGIGDRSPSTKICMPHISQTGTNTHTFGHVELGRNWMVFFFF